VLFVSRIRYNIGPGLAERIHLVHYKSPIWIVLADRCGNLEPGRKRSETVSSSSTHSVMLYHVPSLKY